MLAVLAAAAAAGGCETIGRDLTDLLGNLIPPTPAEAARMALDPHDPDRRRRGTLLLANSTFGGGEPYLAMYRDYVAHEQNPLVRAVAIRALGRHGGPEDAPLIAEQLTHESVQVRWESAKALQRLHNPAVAGDLLVVLRNVDEQTDVRVDAAIALGQYPEDRVYQGLVAALDARDLAINVAAGRSLETLTGQSLGLDPRPWLNWYNAQTDDPFVGREAYLYPTYHRRRTWLEKLAFWSRPVYEQPGSPAGLRSPSERRTYGDQAGQEAPAAAGSGGSDPAGEGHENDR